jgi:hypothetical protein
MPRMEDMFGVGDKTIKIEPFLEWWMGDLMQKLGGWKTS